MHWNIRVMNCPSENAGEDLLMFKEVYYGEDNKPHSYCAPFICGETIESLKVVLERMQTALDHPTLHEDQFTGE